MIIMYQTPELPRFMRRGMRNRSRASSVTLPTRDVDATSVHVEEANDKIQ